jgi:hypothetical protein
MLVKSPDIEVSENGLTVTRKHFLPTKLWQLAKGDKYFKEGRHFWKVSFVATSRGSQGNRTNKHQLRVDMMGSDANRWKICIGVADAALEVEEIDTQTWAGSRFSSFICAQVFFSFFSFPFQCVWS